MCNLFDQCCFSLTISTYHSSETFRLLCFWTYCLGGWKKNRNIRTGTSTPFVTYACVLKWNTGIWVRVSKSMHSVVEPRKTVLNINFVLHTNSAGTLYWKRNKTPAQKMLYHSSLYGRIISTPATRTAAGHYPPQHLLTTYNNNTSLNNLRSVVVDASTRCNFRASISQRRQQIRRQQWAKLQQRNLKR